MSLVIAVLAAWLWLGPPWNVLVVAGALLFELFEIWLFLTLRNKETITGQEALVGATGVAVTDIRPEGQARIRGQLWRVRSSGPLEMGDPLEVLGVDGLTLEVGGRSKERETYPRG